MTCCTTCFIGGIPIRRPVEGALHPSQHRAPLLVFEHTILRHPGAWHHIVFCIGFNLMMLDVQHMQIGLMILGTSKPSSATRTSPLIGSHRMVPRNPCTSSDASCGIGGDARHEMFAGVFSFFDRIFGTYVEPTEELLQGPKGQEFDLHSVPRHVLGI